MSAIRPVARTTIAAITMITTPMTNVIMTRRLSWSPPTLTRSLLHVVVSMVPVKTTTAAATARSSAALFQLPGLSFHPALAWSHSWFSGTFMLRRCTVRCCPGLTRQLTLIMRTRSARFFVLGRFDFRALRVSRKSFFCPRFASFVLSALTHE
jgi:hypothetical protein